MVKLFISTIESVQAFKRPNYMIFARFVTSCWCLDIRKHFLAVVTHGVTNDQVAMLACEVYSWSVKTKEV